MSKENLQNSIKTALVQRGTAKTADEADAQAQILANAIADAIDAYVVAKLTLLAGALQAPGAFAGQATPAGIVTSAPGSISAYNPAA